jgi:hypothetical protein
MFPADLSGADIVTTGLADLPAVRYDTAPALLVSEAWPRLKRRGITVLDSPVADRTGALYRLLEHELGDSDRAYQRCNALRRRMVSFCDALDAEAHRRDS